MQGKRKYLSEFAVNLCSARWLMLPSNQLGSDGTMDAASQAISDNCHIYLICQHPAASYIKENFRYAHDHIEGSVAYRINGELKKFDFRIRYPLLDGAVEVKLSPYPHREIHSVDANGNVVRYLPASALCFGSTRPFEDPNIRRFKVLYVGQAFADGSRSATERLKSHSTLQKILADASYNSPDTEIFLMMFEYDQYRIITQMNGCAEDVINDDRDSARFYSILDNPLTERQQICLAEAALIRYFSPHYNAIYKESFPSPTHKILHQCYELDFSGLIVEINTDDLFFALYSDAVGPKTHHTCSIDLLGHTERRGFFHLSDGDASFLSIPNVIR